MGVAPCVTLHEDFNAVCLNKSVLTVSSTAYREFRNPKTDIFLNRYRVVVLFICILSLAVDNSYLITYSSLRLVAYRQYTWWAHGYLGKGRRRVIPACVVSAIRQCYPDQKEAYTGFHRSEEDDGDEEYWPAGLLTSYMIKCFKLYFILRSSSNNKKIVFVMMLKFPIADRWDVVCSVNFLFGFVCIVCAQLQTIKEP